MPITDFQKLVLQLLRKHRNPNSYVAGGIAIHRSSSSARYSNDIDLFQDTDEAVSDSFKLDSKLLHKEGFTVQILIEQPSFIRATITKSTEKDSLHTLKLEWVRDTSFRFFPVLEDELLGYRLHDADLAINKCLALANRNEVRDIIDLIELEKTTISVAAACWAACGKDPGFTPALILDYMRRHSIIRPEQLAAESFQRNISPPELKQEWLKILDRAAETLELFPAKDLGCLYLDASGKPLRAPSPQDLKGRQKHFGSVGGSWPRAVT